MEQRRTLKATSHISLCGSCLVTIWVFTVCLIFSALVYACMMLGFGNREDASIEGL